MTMSRREFFVRSGIYGGSLRLAAGFPFPLAARAAAESTKRESLSVRVHTLFGFLGDPKYGGNRDFVGWKHVGYPGPRHHQGGYTPEQMAGTAPIETVWGGKL